MLRKMCLILTILVLAAATVQACDMSALIFRQGTVFSDFNQTYADAVFTNFNQPQDYLAFVMDRSNGGVDNDGYGILYYPQGVATLNPGNYWYKYVKSSAEVNHIWYTGNYFNPALAEDVFDKALTVISSDQAKASIVLSHARNASYNPFAPGNHPFRMNANNRTYSLMHNGFISDAVRGFMLDEIYCLDNFWFDSHTPNFSNFIHADSPAYWIDSEVLFNYLMCHIAAAGYDVDAGILSGLQKIKAQMALSTNVVNFIFSDGQRLLAFRSTPVTGLNSAYRLSFKYDQKGYWGIRTGSPSAAETQVRQNEMVVFCNDGTMQSHPHYLDASYLAARQPSGPVSNNNFRVIGTASQSTIPGIRIAFSLEQAAKVSINVYNLKGQRVKNLINQILTKGSHAIYWNGSVNSGRKAAQGIYYIEIIHDGKRTLNKVTYFSN